MAVARASRLAVRDARGACEAVCLWKLDRIALRVEAWFPVAAAQLSGNAAGRVLPGGGATATGVSVAMLRRAGVDTGQAVAALGASSALQLATAFALPLLALPAILGGTPVDHSFAVAAYLGAALFVLLVGAGAIAFTTDRPLELAGRAVQWLLNATVRRRRHVSGFSEQLTQIATSSARRSASTGRRLSWLRSATRASTISPCSLPFAPSAPSRNRRWF